MPDEKTNEGDTGGKEPDTDSTKDKEDVAPVDKVKENLEELKKANDETEAELLRGEELRAKVTQGGKAAAGQEVVKETEDEKWAKDAKLRYEGTGMDPTDDVET